MHQIIAFLKDERAATAVEYGLIAAGVAVVLVTVLTSLGTTMKATFLTIKYALN